MRILYHNTFYWKTTFCFPFIRGFRILLFLLRLWLQRRPSTLFLMLYTVIDAVFRTNQPHGPGPNCMIWCVGTWITWCCLLRKNYVTCMLWLSGVSRQAMSLTLSWNLSGKRIRKHWIFWFKLTPQSTQDFCNRLGCPPPTRTVTFWKSSTNFSRNMPRMIRLKAKRARALPICSEARYSAAEITVSFIPCGSFLWNWSPEKTGIKRERIFYEADV